MVADICPITPEETRMVLCMRPFPEEALVIAQRAKIPAWRATQRLEEMGQKGLIAVYRQEGEMPRYHPIHHWLLRVPDA